MVIYKITNKINGKIYIGQTTSSLGKRWSSHCNTKKTTSIYYAIQKYGKENFIIEEIDGANSLSELNYLEQHYIYMLNSLSPSGYNLVPGGNNFTHCEETRKKMRKPKTYKNGVPIKGPRSEETKRKISETRRSKSYVWTQEMRDKLSKAHKGRVISEETRRNISIGNKGISRGKGRKRSQEAIEKTASANRGKKRSKETSEKLSKVRKGFDSPARCAAREINSKKRRIKVVAIHIESTKEYICNSIHEASIISKIDSSNVSRIINNKKTNCKGWTFKKYE